jgi:hypothetical protein
MEKKTEAGKTYKVLSTPNTQPKEAKTSEGRKWIWKRYAYFWSHGVPGLGSVNLDRSTTNGSGRESFTQTATGSVVGCFHKLPLSL